LTTNTDIGHRVIMKKTGEMLISAKRLEATTATLVSRVA
jgi:hypothetical protein